MKCVICHEQEATIPDREKGGRQKRLCAQCHAERLKADVLFILKRHHLKERNDESGRD